MINDQWPILHNIAEYISPAKMHASFS